MTAPILPGWGQALSQAASQIGEAFNKYKQEQANKKALEVLSQAEKNITINRADGTAKARFTMSDGTVVTIDGTPDEAAAMIARVGATGGRYASDEYAQKMKSATTADEKAKVYQEETSKPAPEISHATAVPAQMPKQEDFKLDIPDKVRARLMAMGIDIGARERQMYTDEMARWTAGEESRFRQAQQITQGRQAVMQEKIATSTLLTQALQRSIAVGDLEKAKRIRELLKIGAENWNDRQLGEARGLGLYQDFNPYSGGGGSTVSALNALRRRFVAAELPVPPDNVLIEALAVGEEAASARYPIFSTLLEREPKIRAYGEAGKELTSLQDDISRSINSAARTKGEEQKNHLTSAALAVGRLGNALGIPGLHLTNRDPWGPNILYRGPKGIIYRDAEGNRYSQEDIAFRVEELRREGQREAYPKATPADTTTMDAATLYQPPPGR